MDTNVLYAAMVSAVHHRDGMGYPRTIVYCTVDQARGQAARKQEHIRMPCFDFIFEKGR